MFTLIWNIKLSKVVGLSSMYDKEQNNQQISKRNNIVCIAVCYFVSELKHIESRVSLHVWWYTLLTLSCCSTNRHFDINHTIYITMLLEVNSCNARHTII